MLTTLAIPMSAFAEEPVTMELVYAIDKVNDVAYASGTKIYPGDVVEVSVSLKASVETTVNMMEFANSIPSGLSLSLSAVSGITNETTATSGSAFLSETTSITATTTGTKLMSGTVTVADAIQSYTVTAATANGEEPMVYDNNRHDYAPSINNLTVTPVTISVEQPTNRIKVDDVELTTDGTTPTYYKSSAKITWESDSSKATATYKVGDGEAVNIPSGTEGVTVNTAGTYEITVGYGTSMTYKRSFILNTQSVDGTISTAVQEDSKGLKYKQGETFTVPVTLTAGPTDSIVGSVAFAVTYDSAVLSMAKGADDTNVVIEGNNVTYTANSNDLTNTLLKKDDKVVDLTFTVLDNAAYGNSEISFAGTGIAIEGSLSETDATLGVSSAKTTILVMPETLATVATVSLPSDWTNTAYDVAVTTAAGETRVYTSDSALVDSADSYASWFEAGTQVADNKITINAYKDYAVVTKLGTSPVAYQATIIAAASTKFDTTVPVIAAGTGGAGVDTWLRTDQAEKTMTVAQLASVTDSIPADGAIKAEYYFGTSADADVTWVEATNGNITIPQNSEAEKITLKWTDAAGNSTAKTEYALKLDATKPVINVTEPTAVSDGKKTVTFTVTDAKGEVDTDTIKVYTSNTGEITGENAGTETTAANAEGTYSFDVTQTTYYKIVASDKAGIPADAKTGSITFAGATDTTTLTAQVVKGADKPTFNFFDTTTMTAKDIKNRAGAVLDGNGTFTYVKLTMPQQNAEIDTTITVTKGGESYSTTTYEFEEVGEYAVTVANKDAADVTKTTTFKFSIVEAENIMTVNGNSVYDVADYGRVRDLITESKTAPDSTSLFYGGFYSGDLNGDGAYTADDYSDLVTNLKARVKLPVNSNYPILNKTVD